MEFAQHYKTIQILNILYNNCSSTLFFLAKIMLGSLVVICNYGSIRLYGRMTYMVYLLFPILSLSVMLFQIVFYPQVGRIFTNSTKLTESRLKVNKSQLNRLVVKSCQSFGIQVGQYYTFQSKTTLSTLNILLQYTVNLLVLY